MRSARLRHLQSLVAVAFIGGLVGVAAPATRAIAVAPPLGAPYTAVIIDGESGDWPSGGRTLVLPTVTVSLTGVNTISFAATAPGGPDYWVTLAPPDNAAWATGTYEAAERTPFRSPGHPGLDVYGDGRGCNTVSGRFVVDDVSVDGNGVPLTFAARFEQHCEGGDTALFGAVSFNSTAPVRSRTLVPNAVDFGIIPDGTPSAPIDVTLTNAGPSPLDIASVAITGADAVHFAIIANTCGGTVAVGDQCTVSVRFQPLAGAGTRTAKLTIFDDLAPQGGGGTGRDVVVTGTTNPPPSPDGEFTALTPARIVDTRDGTGGRSGPLGPGESMAVTVTGVGGVPVTGVAAVVMNVTATEPTAATFVTIWPSGVARPTNSNLNVVAGQSVPNLVTVAVGADSAVLAYNHAGTTHLVFDIVGFYASTTGPAGSRLRAVDPYRLFDTRNGTGGVAAAPVGPDGTLAVQVLGAGPVPATHVSALVLNVTVTEPTASSYLTVFPADVAPPIASNLNMVTGQTVPNLVTVRVPPSGVLGFFNHNGSVHVLADVVGYYDDRHDGTAGRFVGVTPARVLDTRPVYGPLGPNEYGVLTVAGRAGVPPFGASAVVVNVTVTETTAPSYVTVFSDDGCTIPVASNLNFGAGQTVPNLVIVRLSTGSECASGPGRIVLYNHAGSTQLIVDVFGYFTA